MRRVVVELGEALLHCGRRARARRHGARRMRLEVRQDNAAAIRLYERLGYRRFGALRRVLRGRRGRVAL